MRSLIVGGTLGLVAMVVVLSFTEDARAEGYGAAGCGLGSVIIGSEPGFSQVFAATTNGTSQSQTFGITSGTSNCNWKPGTHASAFIEGNREALVKEMARGRGETIVALSNLAGCGDAAKVGDALQAKFGTIVPDASASDTMVSERVIDLLRRDDALACMDLS